MWPGCGSWISRKGQRQNAPEKCPLLLPAAAGAKAGTCASGGDFGMFFQGGGGGYAPLKGTPLPCDTPSLQLPASALAGGRFVLAPWPFSMLGGVLRWARPGDAHAPTSLAQTRRADRDFSPPSED